MVAFYLMKFRRLCERRSWCHHCWSGAVKTRFWRSRLQKRRASLSKTWPLGSSSLLDTLSTRRSHGRSTRWCGTLLPHSYSDLADYLCNSMRRVVLSCCHCSNLITRHSSSTLCCGRTDLEWMLSSELRKIHPVAEYAVTIMTFCLLIQHLHLIFLLGLFTLYPYRWR